MKQLRLVGALLLVVIGFSTQGCAAELTPEQKQLVADLKQDLGRIRQEIEHADKGRRGVQRWAHHELDRDATSGSQNQRGPGRTAHSRA